MKFRKLAALATVVIGALGVSAGTAYAGPAPLPAENSINYEAKLEDKSVVTTIDVGAFKVSGDGKTVELQDAKGEAVVSLPLAYQLGDLQFPFDKKVSEDGKSLTLTPVTDPAKATPIAATGLVLQDVASIEENSAAQSNFATQLGLATAVGGLAGTIIGAAPAVSGFSEDRSVLSRCPPVQLSVPSSVPSLSAARPWSLPASIS